MSTTDPDTQRAVTANEAYGKAMAVLDDLHVKLGADVEVSAERANLRLDLARAYESLGDSIKYTAHDHEE